MFKLKKKLQDLEKRISALEAEIKSHIKYNDPEPQKQNDTLSYEEVIDIWLNGKNS